MRVDFKSQQPPGVPAGKFLRAGRRVAAIMSVRPDFALETDRNMSTPYDTLPQTAFWRTGVARMPSAQPENIYTPKFEIDPAANIATAGSCFAQNFRQAVIDRGYTYLDVEPPPASFSGPAARRYGFSMFSARYGNIYTVRQLLQILEEVDGDRPLAEVVWEREGRYFDALRPSVEPEGLSSPELVFRHREQHIQRVSLMLEKVDVFVFTLGLTEAWMHNDSGRIVPVAPGVISGDFDPYKYTFLNFGPHEIVSDLQLVIEKLRSRNRNIRIILTVSPVPPTATASGEHIFVAASYTKSTLRSAAGWVARNYDFVDYFPSYEFVSNHFSDVSLFNENRRTISSDGVSQVMEMFFNPRCNSKSVVHLTDRDKKSEPEDGDVVCEDFLLDAFAP